MTIGWVLSEKSPLAEVYQIVNWPISYLNPITNPIILISVTLGCGGTSAQNCTYFQSGGQEVGQCRLKICPCSDNICQLRLDFQTFVITGPSTGI